MTFFDAINEPRIEALRPSFEGTNLDFGQSVNAALKEHAASEKKQSFVDLPSKEDVISFIVNYLLELIRENVKPKRKLGKILVDIVLLGIPYFLRKLQKK